MSQLDLHEIREELDIIDKQMASLLKDRMDLCGKVAEYKISIGKQVLDKEREKQKLAVISDLAEDEFMKQSNRDLFEQIMAMSRRLQYSLVRENSLNNENIYGFDAVDEIIKGGIKVVYQGVEGAYSQAAMWKYFGESVESYNVESWRAAMEDVTNGKADYGVFPIENSTAGSICDVYDLLTEYDNYIVGEVEMKISHALLGLRDSNIDDIATVYSHPQALMQSARFLNANKSWKQVSMVNTAVAAKKVLDDNDKSQAAVASEYAAKVYGLKVLKNNINDEDINTTRFIVVTHKKIFSKNSKKISVSFGIPNESGTLYNILGNFVYNHLNMIRIESRPMRNERWSYRFFIDFEGNLDDLSVKNALYAIEQESTNFKVLGNF